MYCQSFPQIYTRSCRSARDIAVLTQNKHEIVICRGGETRNAPKNGELHQVGGVCSEKVADKSTLIGQDDGSNPADLVAQHAEGEGSHQGAQEEQRLTDPRFIGIITHPVQLGNEGGALEYQEFSTSYLTHLRIHAPESKVIVVYPTLAGLITHRDLVPLDLIQPGTGGLLAKWGIYSGNLLETTIRQSLMMTPVLGHKPNYVL